MAKKPASNSLLLRSVKMVRVGQWPDHFPYNVPVIQNLEELVFQSPVTFLVGENGSGKSTLLEALACAVGSITVGRENIEHDQTLAQLRQLAKNFRLMWSKRTHKGFFMRSEDFFGFARRMEQTRADMESFLQDVDRDYKDRSEMAWGLSFPPIRPSSWASLALPFSVVIRVNWPPCLTKNWSMSPSPAISCSIPVCISRTWAYQTTS